MMLASTGTATAPDCGPSCGGDNGGGPFTGALHASTSAAFGIGVAKVNSVKQLDCTICGSA